MTLVAPVPAWMFEHWNEVGGKYSLPSSQVMAASSAMRGGGEVDRIARELRIGDVALHAADAGGAGERAASSVLDHVAEAIHRRGLADDAVVDALAARGEPLDHLHGSVGRRPFLVRGEQQGDRSGVAGMRGDEATRRR